MSGAVEPPAQEIDDGRSAVLAADVRRRGHTFTNSQISGHPRVHFGDSYIYIQGLSGWAIVVVVVTGIVLAFGANVVPIPAATSANAPFVVPFARNPHFVPRDAITNQLNEFERTHEHARAALYGIGGVGKTQIAVEYAHSFHRRHPDSAVYWLYAGTAARLDYEFRQLANFLDVSTLGTPCSEKINSSESIIDAVLRQLSDESKGHWLLVIDNVDDLNLLTTEDTSPKQSLLSRIPQTWNCKVLVTTTNRRVAEALTGRWSNPIEVGLVGVEDAELFLRSRTPDELLHTGNLTELIDALHYLPLAISQAAAYMRYYGVHAQEYVDYLKNDPQSLLGRAFDLELSTRDRDQPTAVVNTLNITLTRLGQNNPAAAYLVELMSYFEHESIPDFLLLSSTPMTPRELKEALGALVALSIVSKDDVPESTTRSDHDYESYSFHRVASMVLRILTHPRTAGLIQERPPLANIRATSGFEGRRVIQDASASILMAWPAGDNIIDVPRKTSLFFHGVAVLKDPLGSSVDEMLRVRLFVLLGTYVIQHYNRWDRLSAVARNTFLSESRELTESAEALFQNASDICDGSDRPDMKQDLLCLEALWGFFVITIHRNPLIFHGFEVTNTDQVEFREVEFDLEEVTERPSFDSSPRFEEWSVLIRQVAYCVEEMKQDNFVARPYNETLMSDVVDFILRVSCTSSDARVPNLTGWQLPILAEAYIQVVDNISDAAGPPDEFAGLGRIELLSHYLYRRYTRSVDRSGWTMTVWFGPQLTRQSSSAWVDMKEKFELCVRDISQPLEALQAQRREPRPVLNLIPSFRTSV